MLSGVVSLIREVSSPVLDMTVRATVSASAPWAFRPANSFISSANKESLRFVPLFTASPYESGSEITLHKATLLSMAASGYFCEGRLAYPACGGVDYPPDGFVIVRVYR